MKTRTLLLASALLAFSAHAATARDTSCIVTGKDAAVAPDAAGCQGGPLKAGDPRFGQAPVPRTSDRLEATGHSFEIGGSTVTVSGSIRVDGVYSSR